jgi:uncharacterized damage-inducible protein DinB
MKRAWIPLLALALATPASAQEQGGGSVAGVKGLFDMVKGYITRSAEQMPEADFAFKPTPEVRSFGQLLGHIANSGYMFCSSALGETAPTKPDAETLTSKAQLVAALNESFAYCDRAYAMADARAGEPLTVFGRPATRLYALEFNMGHDFEHYGNIVTYMRLKGLVPPSSQRGGGQ